MSLKEFCIFMTKYSFCFFILFKQSFQHNTDQEQQTQMFELPGQNIPQKDSTESLTIGVAFKKLDTRLKFQVKWLKDGE